MHEFSIAHVNARSLFTNFDIFRDHLLINDYNIIAVTETWLSADEAEIAVSIHGYELIHKDRNDRRGGGVAFYLKKELQYDLFNTTVDGIEQLWIKVKLGKTRVVFGVAYRPEWVNLNDFLNALEQSITYAIPLCDNLICTGDFNIDLLKINSSKSIHFLNMINTFGLYQLINSPTRITKNSSTLLDVIIVSNKKVVSESGVKELHGLSDHCLVYCKFMVESTSSSVCTRTYREFKNFDHESFNMSLEAVQWNLILNCNSIDEKLLFFNENLLNVINTHAPIRTAKFSKPPSPWLTDTIKLMQRLRDNALVRFKRSKNIHHWNYYKSLRNLTTNAIRREKRAYLEYRTRISNKRTLWKDLKDLNVYNKSQIPTIPLNLQDANKINNYFIESVNAITTAPDQNLIDFYSNNRENNSDAVFSFTTISEEVVVKIIKTINSKSVGVDDIGIELINLSCPFLVPYITHVVNFCLEHNVFPKCWKTARILPLPKTKNPTELKDLRPISILPTFSKILERAMDFQLRDFLNSHSLLPVTQSGFRKGYSCTTALAKILDDILIAIDNNQLTALVLLDFSKAFDTINHKVLLAILHYIGLSNDAILLLKNYLLDRSQLVKLANQVSDIRAVGSGVPQGSILGPLLYTIYTSTLGNSIKSCSYHFYADDTQLYYSFNPKDIFFANNLINTDLNNLIAVAEKHSLIINPSKSQIMLFGRRKSRTANINNLVIQVKNSQLPITEASRNLGLHIDSDLRFKKHISLCIQKAYLNLKFIFSNRHILNKNTKIILTEALVLSQFNFCDTVYGPCLDSVDSARIQRIQNCCIRLIFGLRRRDHVSHKLPELKWLNMAGRRIMHSYSLFHKVLTLKTPPYLFEKVRYRSDVHNINIRSKGLLTPPFHRTSMYQRSFSYNIAKYYNSLPPQFKKLPQFKFKKQLYSYLLIS